ncbi:hypothetical protein [Clostridium saccharoperbutylacetonicum]|uniref:hypothetical protein n=1 Tax=Clostridium saccharoperbutylacetonicum TaxID=36745 RepID=UPI0039EA1889
MKNYGCPHCGSVKVFIKERGTQKALMCGDCCKWIKWVGKNEVALIEKFILENKGPIKQDKNAITSEEDAFNNLCRQISDYMFKNHNPYTSIVISGTDIKIIENVENKPIKRWE